MKLFVDEDTGRNLAIALGRMANVEIDFVADERRIKKGTADEEWLRYVGENGYLAISRNDEILDVEAARRALIASNVGILFLPNRATSEEMLQLLRNNWPWVEHLAEREPRPFAWSVLRNGKRRRRRLR